MKYIVVGKDVKKGMPGSDSANLHQYTELGWEVTTTFLEAGYYRKRNVFKSEDVLVTASGREFLYRKLFDNVMTYADFHPKIDTQGVEVVDLVGSLVNRLRNRSFNRPLGLLYSWIRYRHQFCHTFSVPDIIYPEHERKLPDGKFLCICIRKRDHAQQRNLPDSYWRDVLDALADEYCFIVGIGGESFVKHPKHQSCSLDEFCTFAASPKCIGVIGTMTGTMQLAQLVHGNRLIAIDIEAHHQSSANTHPCILSDCCNFNKVKISIYTYIPQVKDIIADIKGEAGNSRVFSTTRHNRAFHWMFKMHRRRGHRFYEFPL